jgi:starvation-inducible DNA-binding protein
LVSLEELLYKRGHYNGFLTQGDYDLSSQFSYSARSEKMSKTNGTKIIEKTPDLGLSKNQQQDVATILKIVLADESILYQKLRNYHWNVTGPMFFSLHKAFEDQYNELADIVDEVAERIRQFSVFAPGTLEEFKQITRLNEQPGVYPDAKTMVANLVKDHEASIRNLRGDIEMIDKKDDEVGAADLLTGILQQHQKMAWMLRMVLEG